MTSLFYPKTNVPIILKIGSSILIELLKFDAFSACFDSNTLLLVTFKIIVAYGFSDATCLRLFL